MNGILQKIWWKRVLGAGVLTSLLNLAIAAALITTYAMVLAIRSQGPPDQAKLSFFANWVGDWCTPLLGILMSFLSIFWVMRKVPQSPLLHGLLTGLTVSICGLFLSLLFGGDIG